MAAAAAILGRIGSTQIPSPRKALWELATRRSICSSFSSPYNEKHSPERYRHGRWLCRETTLLLEGAEGRHLLQVLKEKRKGRCHGDKNDRGCGPGYVYLIGTGPGDPEQMPLKTVGVSRGANLVLYDRPVSHDDVLELVGEDAGLLYVGKTAGYHCRTQEEIHDLLLSFVEAGATVC